MSSRRELLLVLRLAFATSYRRLAAAAAESHMSDLNGDADLGSGEAGSGDGVPLESEPLPQALLPIVGIALASVAVIAACMAHMRWRGPGRIKGRLIDDQLVELGGASTVSDDQLST